MRGIKLRNALSGALILGLGLLGCESQPTGTVDPEPGTAPSMTQTIGAGGGIDTTGTAPQEIGGEPGDSQTIGAGG
jgi:hypothetical protein